MIATAPGKLVLAGEYVVLEGARAIVTAVSMRVRLSTAEVATELPPEVVATRSLAEAAFGETPERFALDVRALRGETKKLGLGSSAAAAAATVSLIAALRHRATTPEERFDLALRGHAAVAPRGSGIDVAASVFGGTRLFQIEGDTRKTQPTRLPSGLHPVVVYTGEEARTSTFVRAIDALSADARKDAMAPLHEAAERCVRAFEQNDARALVAAVSSHHDAMARLGEKASVPIVEAHLAAIAARAARFGGAAKPSGAGGGDVAIAFFLDEESARRFREASNAEGHLVVQADLGVEGAGIDGSIQGSAR